MKEKIVISDDTPAANGVDLLKKVENVIDVLDRRGESTAAEISREMNAPMSSVYRLLGNLSTLGLVEQGTRRGLYRLGVYFMRIGSTYEDQLDVRYVSNPHLRALRHQTGATCALWVRRAYRAVCIERLIGNLPSNSSLRIGDSLPMYRGAASKALLAHLPPAEQAALLEELERMRNTDKNVPPRSRIEFEIRQDSARGYSTADSEVMPGVIAFAAPIFNHRGELEAVVASSALGLQISTLEQSMVKLVVTTAAEISRGLGYEGKAP